ncbi:MAG: hypothetical protein A2406_02720 [Candidatus Komeilibacteria bacterium RIFOXYC1_FULL_37_11]|uniref:Uncharacterized protein n=1 Tax=Candidatus Komeilibacteria bacterium RIFOXYC1_FULL_37_11 TaxID=1798555 RepID=A0A1G2BWI3_9BACT|nr:MAG: hypothetical protein A2406_02720 [Candidatus Komeilibacteria bacterium RIFOXYC1_FULL_37_11]OGY95421.1 MAG: hypothetical protein A2611_01845 [Candidatus Komeilibacteria bacterium RIFOXYD1_FULL_37_29]OGY96839.1 MAG: hypothetical protein A2543_00395 [Candidatus Komeilibacteria bacterium RIFOXYD2_FULL_37_8]
MTTLILIAIAIALFFRLLCYLAKKEDKKKNEHKKPEPRFIAQPWLVKPLFGKDYGPIWYEVIDTKRFGNGKERVDSFNWPSKMDACRKNGGIKVLPVKKA